LRSENSKKNDDSNPNNSRWRENVEAILVAVLIALFIRTFVVQAFKIPSGSMKQTLQIGDHILVNKFIYGIKIPYWQTTIIPFKNPQKGDIIVFKYPMDPDKAFIKRVIGVAGDVIKIRKKKLYLNGELANHDFAFHSEPKINKPGRDDFGPITVPENSLFVMGDNRDASHDSRFWGFVDLKAVNGKAFIIYWSWDGDEFGPRWSRLGKILR